MQKDSSLKQITITGEESKTIEDLLEFIAICICYLILLIMSNEI